MPTVIIRPDNPSGDTGFDQSGPNLVSRINDNDDGTLVNQTNTTSNFTVFLANSSDYSGATINSIQLSVRAKTSGKASECTSECIIKNSSGTALQSDTLQFGTSFSTQTGTSYSTSLTPTVVDGLQVTIDPDANGIAIAEVFLTVDYTTAAVATTPFIGMKSGKYKIVGGKIKI